MFRAYPQLPFTSIGFICLVKSKEEQGNDNVLFGIVEINTKRSYKVKDILYIQMAFLLQQKEWPELEKENKYKQVSASKLTVQEIF